MLVVLVRLQFATLSPRKFICYSNSSDGGAAASPRGDYEGSTHEHDDELLDSSGYEDEDANDSRLVVVGEDLREAVA
ncbi:hypothetical protein PC116_g20564 [Phytophthora cactorum]|uniref:Uncharacterized protein n=1 Tax=Phytophthora cactorum TaxID=29920 RepID=A0A8T1BGF9_9STRA|nr:hypothetical protein PC113_g16451 [Phytophthora cactorum]KAG2889295.1 hypothetical protein PC114_g18022 [Phytophthora cactorum]KAG2901448.1 hypothetical protein PC115_g15860 [Phytophthora cactorum]KAG2923788.1 hypothetical protein PC117_g15599 [Phytophthora cactorum]KAG3000227.1 hypothetical protein PC119_g17038 [Phytophthora cactorum]